jgi:undecaprenyl-diphosphatase
MNLLEVVVLGLIQGLTEFIPVSSSGHLVIAQELLGYESDHLLLEAINIGTFLALIVYFWPRIIKIIRDVTVRRNYRLARNILLTSIPAGAVGYLMADVIAGTAFFGSLTVVMITLAVVGGLMVVLEKLPKLSATKDGESLSAPRALGIGLVQMVALVPGVSRSGSTIIAGRLVGLSAKAAAEYSFLASLPIMAGVTLKVFVDNGDYLAANATNLIVGNAVAFVSGIAAVHFLLSYLSRHGLAVFGWYRLVLAAIIGLWLLVQL